MAALGAFEHDIATLRAVGKKTQLGEHIAIQFVLASQALQSTDGASCRLLLHLGKTYSPALLVTHLNFTFENHCSSIAQSVRSDAHILLHKFIPPAVGREALARMCPWVTNSFLFSATEATNRLTPPLPP